MFLIAFFRAFFYCWAAQTASHLFWCQSHLSDVYVIVNPIGAVTDKNKLQQQMLLAVWNINKNIAQNIVTCKAAYSKAILMNSVK